MYRSILILRRLRNAPALAAVALLAVGPAAVVVQSVVDDPPTESPEPAGAPEPDTLQEEHPAPPDDGGDDADGGRHTGNGRTTGGIDGGFYFPDDDDDEDEPAPTTIPLPVPPPVPPSPVVDPEQLDDAAPVERGPSEEVDAPPPVEELPVEIVEPDPGLRAEIYDGIYAQGVPVWVAMAATRELESGGNYAAEAAGSTASGAYQVIDSTWAGYGGYARSVDAPPAVQDQFAYESMVLILKRFGNDVSSIPLAWYYPAALRNPSLMDEVPRPDAGNVLTPRQYQARWMAAFHRLLEDGSPVFLPADSDPLVPAIAFPVLGPTWFYDDWHAPRDNGDRVHEGLDFLGVDGQPLRAAFDGVVTRFRPYNVGRPGVGITITREDGVRANYFHLDEELRWHPTLEVGETVKAGQIVGFMGSTGNAGIPHLHFELRTPDGDPMAPYPATLEAIQREQCSVGIGPWSTEFSSPAQIAALLAEAEAARLAELEAGETVDPVDDVAADGEPGPLIYVIEGPDDAEWIVTTDGMVMASGVGALIAPDQGDCSNVPEGTFGTGAKGMPIDQLPEEWWGEDVDPDELAEMIAAVISERSSEFDPIDGTNHDAFERMRIGRREPLPEPERPEGAIVRPFQR